jgi:ribosomal protein S12 methylthiotransferase accessory factor
MKLQHCAKNEYGRCVPLAETIAKLETLLGGKYDYWIHEEEVAPSLHWSALFIDNIEFRSMGKGVNPEQSRAGALAEAAEWLTPLETERLPGYVAAHQDAIENVLPIEDLLSHIANATPPLLDHIKSLDIARHWVDGWCLTDKGPIKVPIEYIKMINGPNGKAAGNRLEEAIVHAVNEVFERRVHVAALRHKMILPTIIPESIHNPIIKEQMEFIGEQNIEITLKDLSLGGVMPCVGAYFKDRSLPEDYQFHHAFKVGSSFNREEALIRVFTEYAQGRKRDEFNPSSPADLERVLKPDFRSLPSQDGACDNFLSTFMFGFVPYRDASFLEEGERTAFDPGTPSDDCLRDIDMALEICRKLGKELIAVDMSDPASGFYVVQVVIPSYSDALPFHPPSSPGLFRHITRSDVLKMFAR